jgi:hypothetical protein
MQLGEQIQTGNPYTDSNRPKLFPKNQQLRDVIFEESGRPLWGFEKKYMTDFDLKKHSPTVNFFF